MKRLVFISALLMSVALTNSVGADEPSPRRPVPNYVGRPPAPPTVGQVALWVPRVVLAPAYLVSEYLIRWPLSVAIPAAERADLPRKIYDLFTFGPEHKAGVAPVCFVEFGFNPSVGVYAFWDDALFSGNSMRLHAEAWPSDWIAGSVTERVQIDRVHAVQFRAKGIRRPDHVFYGLGPDSSQSHQSRYGEDRLDVGALYEWRFWRASRIQTGVGLRASSVHDGQYGTDPGLTEEALAGAFAIPYGFGRAYTAEYNRLVVVVDTRQPRPSSGSGLRVEVRAEQGSDFHPSPASGWIRYGGAAGGYVDLNGHGRVLGIAITTAFVDPLGARPVPFTELASLGGDGPMRGYYPGRLVDRSAAAASAHYVWPIAPWLDGRLEAAIGNVWGEHLQAFQPDRLRFSGDIGVSTPGTGDYPIEFVVGVGSETFAHGGTIDSARLTLSVNHGF